MRIERRLSATALPLVAALGLALSTATPATATGASMAFTEILSGYARPVLATGAPGLRKRLYIVEQTGRIRTARRVHGTWVKQGVFLDLTALVNDPTIKGSGERGLLGLAFPPDHAVSGRFYVSYTHPRTGDPSWKSGDTVVAEYRRTSPRIADPASARVVMVIEQPWANHNGGHIAFGPDGYLYLGLGDGGGYGDPDHLARDLGSPMGKLLRIDPTDPDGDGSATHTVPADNPFVGRDDAIPEIWASGLRNPWRFSFDRASGDLWIGDVGEDHQEEVDRARATGGRDAAKGLDWGWATCEGTRAFPGGGPCPSTAEGIAGPRFIYRHATGGPADGGCAVTGGHVVRGPGAPDWQGVYLLADLCTGLVTALGPGGRRLLTRPSGRMVTSFGEDAAGRIFLTDLAGSIVAVTFTGDPTP